VRHHTVQVPATSANLGAGFDAFGLALDLHLAARTVDRSDGAPRVTNRGLGADVLPTDDDNLVWRSFRDACVSLRPSRVPDVALEVTNRIPLERGLGSSSAAIVAGIVLARAVTDVPSVGEPALVELAATIEGHPDNVAPAILGGLVAGARGETGFVVRRINPLPGHVALAFVPPAVAVDRRVTHDAACGARPRGGRRPGRARRARARRVDRAPGASIRRSSATACTSRCAHRRCPTVGALLDRLRARGC
jgi:homoserine kinase